MILASHYLGVLGVRAPRSSSPTTTTTTTTIRRSVCTCIFVRGRRPVAGWPHGRLIGLLDRDVPTTTTLLLLLCTGAHYSHKGPPRCPALMRACNARVCPTFIALHKRTPRIRLGDRRGEHGGRAMRICRPFSIGDPSSTLAGKGGFHDRELCDKLRARRGKGWKFLLRG